MFSRQPDKFEQFFLGGGEDGSSFYTKNHAARVLHFLDPIKHILVSAIGKLYFLGKINFGNVNCARATAFIFDTRTDVLVKVSKFLRQRMFLPEGDSNPQPSDSCRML